MRVLEYIFRRRPALEQKHTCSRQRVNGCVHVQAWAQSKCLASDMLGYKPSGMSLSASSGFILPVCGAEGLRLALPGDLLAGVTRSRSKCGAVPCAFRNVLREAREAPARAASSADAAAVTASFPLPAATSTYI